MTIQSPPIFLQAGSHPAEDVRRWIGASVSDTPGVVASTDLEVTEKSGTPNMSVDVATGRCFIEGTEGTYQGLYFADNRGITNVAISASDATNPRKDLIVVRVRDAAYSGASNSVAIEVVTGTPAASPTEPAVPDNCLVLAMVDVDALATSIVDADITDRREQAYGLGVAGVQAQLANLPQKIVTGTTLITFTSGSGTLTFGDTFGATPVVLVTANYSATVDVNCYVSSVTTTQCSVTMRISGAAYTGSRFVNWVAIGTAP